MTEICIYRVGSLLKTQMSVCLSFMLWKALQFYRENSSVIVCFFQHSICIALKDIKPQEEKFIFSAILKDRWINSENLDLVHFLVKCCLEGLLKIMMLILGQVRLSIGDTVE